MSITNRLSQMSAVAPDASDSSMMGRVVDAWTRATMSADGAIDVIIHDAPTAWMRVPKLETRLAVQIIAKTREWNGARVGESRHDWGTRERKREWTVTPGNTSTGGRLRPDYIVYSLRPVAVWRQRAAGERRQ